jgi:glutathione peroxidase
MRMLLVLSALSLLASLNAASADDAKGAKTMSGPLNFKMKAIDGKEVDLASFKGKVVLFVNVASRCGYTGQYTGLQKLHDAHGKDGLVVVGVPANEFGRQEPGTDEEIQKFCSTKYNVTFPMMAKVVVKGEGICPLYEFLTSKEKNAKFAGPIGWNFEKFLINREGEVVGRFKSGVEPDSEELIKAIKTELEKK